MYEQILTDMRTTVFQRRIFGFILDGDRMGWEHQRRSALRFRNVEPESALGFGSLIIAQDCMFVQAPELCIFYAAVAPLLGLPFAPYVPHLPVDILYEPVHFRQPIYSPMPQLMDCPQSSLQLLRDILPAMSFKIEAPDNQRLPLIQKRDIVVHRSSSSHGSAPAQSVGYRPLPLPQH